MTIQFNGYPLTLRIFLAEQEDDHWEIDEQSHDLLQVVAQAIEMFGFIPAKGDFFLTEYGSGSAFIEDRILVSGGARIAEDAEPGHLRLNLNMRYE